jgi:hypothetical protein
MIEFVHRPVGSHGGFAKANPDCSRTDHAQPHFAFGEKTRRLTRRAELSVVTNVDFTERLFMKKPDCRYAFLLPD